ncbi:TetR/AcrR family transcriptional regulator [Paenibacillus apiarius]|uniref:TetR/AcrR family transcriptional regulator n=1 Tax=Paenibacillus apiarius TaxID=46240 RepID=A0ABT4E0T1_9BACL|nr:TetR/AcrR family transcriptional regulator [Paenibacillus apiarius]MCY9513853.1 TetR/AcrR family transcriptional regulator [Paenibacillus apiarius]MCY9523214.1 TetR/AcrR family transcriptional regulator [Paenibacillus apiarius]MCY9555525.1 TetR/AcrR family transcriptional regulator [Paenibacillus apiarius]MCY9560899.1 TetR/AcrR family transcriptional regulator [Paenibacillus apiarius]MCY9682820.1 TetR/AcrR family transcriptional regulator [Paenibacillus apiarius]
MDAALKIIACKGYHSTKISDVVKAAGVSQGTFYWYFQSKEQLVLKLIEDGKEKLIKVIAQGYRKHTGTIDDMVSSSARLLADLFLFADRNRNLMALLLIKGQGADPPVREAVSQTWIAFEEAFKSNIQRAMELEMLPRTNDLALRANILVCLITGVLSKWLFGPMHEVDYKSVYSPSEIAEETAKFEFRGLLG